MAKGKQRVGRLAAAFDSKVEDLIYRLLEERSVEKRRLWQERLPEDEARDTEDNASLQQLFFAKHLGQNEIYFYCLAKDLSLQRCRKVVLQRTIEKVLKDVVEAEAAEFGEDPEYNPVDVDVDGDGDENMMVDNGIDASVNNMNRRITEQWSNKSSTPPASSLQTKDEESKDEETNDEETKDQVQDTAPTPNKELEPTETKQDKSKKRVKEGTGRSKRQKTKVDRSPPNTSLKDLGGVDDVIAQLMELIGLPILHPEIYITTGIQPSSGVLLHGPPGCGKTSIANALAGELKVPFIAISAPSVVSGMSGESEKKIRDIFDEAKSLAPCLVFFDEIDAITPKRDGGAQREMERRIVAQLLTAMDELAVQNGKGNPVIVIGATNRPDALDTALRRAGRFDREICLNVPNEVSRLHILKKMSEHLKIDGQVDFLKLSKLTPGFVGADLKALTTAAGTCAIKRIFQNSSLLYPNKDENSKTDTNTNTVDSIEVAEPSLPNEESSLKNTANMIDPLPLSIIQQFLYNFPDPLSNDQLNQLSIRYEDFLKALPTIQPTAKREGFATVPDVTWANVGALGKIRIELNLAIVQPIKRPELYEKVGINAPGGVLLWGPPGCGKTLLAKAVANESRANFISIKGPELLNKYVGESERAIRQVFVRARASVPCVIFFDELDALVPRRDTSLSESSSRVVNTLLTELDGLSDRHGIFVIGATNRPDIIDPAMLRPGRLDKTLFIELPNEQEKLDIIKTLLKSQGTPLASDINLEEIISNERCKNFSGADLASLVRESSILALKRKFFKSGEVQSIIDNDLDKEFEDLSVGVGDDEILVTMKDFVDATEKIKPSVSDSERRSYNRLNMKLGWDDHLKDAASDK